MIDTMELVDRFLAWKEYSQGRAGRTIDLYRLHLSRMVDYCRDVLGKDPLAVAPDDLEVFTGIYMHKQGLAPLARRTVVAAVRGFYGWLEKNGLLATHLAAAVPYPKAGRKLPSVLSLEDAERLIMAPDLSTFIGVRDAAMMGVLLGCGLRVGGLIRLNVSDMNFVIGEGGERLVVRVREKGDKERLVPAPGETRLLVRAYLGHEDLRHIDSTLDDGDQVLFVSTKNTSVPAHEYHGEARRLSAWSVRKRISVYGEAVGIPTKFLHPHAMRHLYGKELAEDEVDQRFGMALMGHEDPKSHEVYSHLSTRKLTKIVDRSSPISKIRTPVSDLLKRIG